MNDVINHFYATVGHILDQAAVGELPVRLELSDGTVVEGVPGAFEVSDRELDDTGYARRLQLDGTVIELERVRRATLVHPLEPSEMS